MSNVTIPTRFEHILGNASLQAAPLILPVEEDLRAVDRARRTAETQGGGLLLFVRGPSGCGKTTTAYSAAAALADKYSPVLAVPHHVPLRNVYRWLSDNLPSPSAKTTLVLLDGREVSDDTVGLKQLMASLNQLLRSRPDVVAYWPTTDPDWRETLLGIASSVGGSSLLAGGGEIEVQGPPREAWHEMLGRILAQLDQTLDNIAISQELIDELAASEPTPGAFLGSVRDAIASRVDAVQAAKQLPRLLFVVTSHSEVVGEANRVRRAASLLLKAEEMLSYSARSRAAKWWKSRLADPNHHLGYVVSLFNARLVTMTPSSVVYACAEFGDDYLRDAVKTAGISRSASNADRTFQNTDFFRLLAGRPLTELTSTMKGKTAASTLEAFAAIQSLSATKHKAINQAICALAQRNVPGFAADKGEYEVDLGTQGAFADAVVALDGDDQHLEFHHLSAAQCKASSMAAYVMEKLQYYAIHYNLVPR